MDVAIIAAFACRSNQERDDYARSDEVTSDEVREGAPRSALFYAVAADVEPLNQDPCHWANSRQHMALAAVVLGPKTTVVGQRAERLDRVGFPALTSRRDRRVLVMPIADAGKVLKPNLTLQRLVLFFLDDYKKFHLTSAPRALLEAERAMFDVSYLFQKLV